MENGVERFGLRKIKTPPEMVKKIVKLEDLDEDEIQDLTVENRFLTSSDDEDSELTALKSELIALTTHKDGLLGVTQYTLDDINEYSYLITVYAGSSA
jgi:hypothetical protein